MGQIALSTQEQELRLRRLLAPISLEEEIITFPESVRQEQGEIVIVTEGEEERYEADLFEPAELEGWTELRVNPPARDWEFQTTCHGPKSALKAAHDTAMDRFLNFGGESFEFDGETLVIRGEGEGHNSGFFSYSFTARGTPK